MKQLQTALDSLGCNAGPKDGIIGPKTRAAIACGEQKTSATGLQDLGQKLNLNLSPSTENASPNSGAAGGNVRPSDTTGTNAVKGRRRQTSGQNAGRIRPVPTRSDTSANKSGNDTSAVQGQTGQQGTVDTTTSKGAIDTTFNQRDTTQMNRTDTTQMNRSDTTQMNRSDTTQMNRSDTTQMNRTDTTMLRDTTQMR
ncbi:MAG TPA: peptidoglycan-binding domain-containing protein, partial [Gemmatimonadaceae bacterium]|nr:peptidoglycan-binding domain-containing protein [Gemmatimonadaceae bacterium]